MSLIPKKKICEKCNKPFNTTVDEQNICNDCLIKPRRFSLMKQQSTPEVPMLDNDKTDVAPVSNAPKGEKICEDCKKPFKLNSGRQKRCNACKKLREAHRSRKPRKKRNTETNVKIPVVVEQKRSKSSGQTFVEMGLTLLTDIGVNKLKIEDERMIISIEKIKE